MFQQKSVLGTIGYTLYYHTLLILLQFFTIEVGRVILQLQNLTHPSQLTNPVNSTLDYIDNIYIKAKHT